MPAKRNGPRPAIIQQYYATAADLCDIIRAHETLIRNLSKAVDMQMKSYLSDLQSIANFVEKTAPKSTAAPRIRGIVDAIEDRMFHLEEKILEEGPDNIFAFLEKSSGRRSLGKVFETDIPKETLVLAAFASKTSIGARQAAYTSMRGAISLYDSARADMLEQFDQTRKYLRRKSGSLPISYTDYETHGSRWHRKRKNARQEENGHKPVARSDREIVEGLIRQFPKLGTYLAKLQPAKLVN